MDKTDEYGRVRTLAEKLCAAGVPEERAREVRSSALASGGTQPCSFWYTVVE